MSELIELEPLKPLQIKDDKMIRHFEQIVNSFGTTYFNIADVPMIEIYCRTYSELLTLYEAQSLAGSAADEGNKQYQKLANLIDKNVKQLMKLGTSLRINPQQRKASPTTRTETPTEGGRNVLPTTREAVTHGEIWDEQN